MKKIKTIVSLLLALTLAILPITAFTVNAADSTLTIKNANSSTTYTAYQIFTGDASNGTLSNVEWGSLFTNSYSTFVESLKSDTTLSSYFTDLSDAYTAADIAEALSDITNSQSKATDVEALVKILKSNINDTTTGTTLVAGTEANTLTATLAAGYYIVLDGNGAGTVLQVVGPTEIDTKSVDGDTPSLEKELGSSKNKILLNEDVTFNVKVTLPNDLEQFAKGIGKYTFVVNDTLSNLTLSSDAISVSAKDSTDNAITLSTSSINVSTVASTGDTYAVSTTGSGTDDDTLEIKYTIELNSSNYATYQGATITFSYDATVGSEYTYDTTTNTASITKYSNDPATTTLYEIEVDDIDEKTVTIYEYNLVLTKTYDGTAPKAEDMAKFTLYDSTGSTAVGSEVSATVDGTSYTYTWTGLGEGTYTLKETTAAVGYNRADDVTFTISKDSTGDTSSLNNVTTGANFNVAVTSETDQTTNVTTKTATISGSIENKSGSILPSTGGMGTKIFYTLGGILVIGAAILLITKRRMGENR